MNNKQATKLALQVSLPQGGEPTRAQELEATLKASTHGFDKALEDAYSDEVVYLVEGELLNGAVLDHTDPDTLEASLVTAGYKVVDLFTWAKDPHSFL